MENKRIETLDFAKGFALFFMIVQHLSIWFGGGVGAKSSSFIKSNPIYFAAISFAAVSAPIFVFCAGCSAKFFMDKYGDGFKIFKRGLVLILFGYLLNLAIPSWFSPASWYVLHMIGFGLMVVPLLQKTGKAGHVIMFFAVFIIAITAQTYLNTPQNIGNRWMSDMSLPFPLARFAFVEGHFPVFPWLAFFIFGYGSAGLISAGRFKNLFVIGVLLFFLSAILTLMPQLFPLIKSDPFFSRLVSLKPRFYPMLGPVFFLLTGSLPFIIFIFYKLAKHVKVFSVIFIPLGRISLTVFITHVFIKQLVYILGIAESFSKWPTIGMTVLVLGFYIFLERNWRKTCYRFGFEWILRKLT